MGGERLELVRRGAEGKAGESRDPLRHALGKPDRRVEAGADRRAALGKLHQPRQRLLQPLDAEFELAGIAGKFLAEGERGRVLGMGAADLEDIGPGLGLGVQRRVQVLQGRNERTRYFHRAGDVHGGWIGVVRRLAHIDVVVRMDRLLRAHDAAERLDRPVRDHLIGIHVGLGARAGLPDRQRKVVVELAGNDLVGGGDDRLADGGIEPAERHVGLRRGALDDAERLDHRFRLFLGADAEEVQGALRLRAPIAVRGDVDGAERIGFYAGLGHGCLLWPVFWRWEGLEMRTWAAGRVAPGRVPPRSPDDTPAPSLARRLF